MPFDSANLFLENFVPESGFEFTLTEGRGRDTHSFLAAAE